MLVYVTPYGGRFHQRSDCSGLNGRASTTVDLKELKPMRPCAKCFPGAPRVKTYRRYCPICSGKRTRPCEHNGGVRMKGTFTTSYVSVLRRPGDLVERTIWVWPDQAHLYEPLAL